MTFAIALALVIILPIVVRVIGFPVAVMIAGAIIASIAVRAHANGVAPDFSATREKLGRANKHWSPRPFFNPELSTLENLAAQTVRTLVWAAGVYVAFHLAGYVL